MHIFDIIFLIIITFFVFTGLRKGLIEEAVKLVGFIVASFLAAKYYFIGATVIKGIFPESPGVQSVLGAVLVFVIVYMLLQLVAAMMRGIIRSLKLAWLDKSTGAAFGAAKGLAIMIIVVWILSVFMSPVNEDALQRSSLTYGFLKRSEQCITRRLKVEDELSALRGSLRELFLLDREKRSIST